MSKSISLRGWFRKRPDGNVDKAKSLPNPTGLDTAKSTSQSLPKQEDDGAVQETHLKVPDLTSQDELGQDKCGLFLLSDEVGQQMPKYNVDIVAVHGLGGDAYRTWTHDNGKIWLRDFLPTDIPEARVFTYGYNSTLLFSRETGRLREYARALLEDIRSERTLADETARPLIFVCHSMGGIIVKQALIIANNESTNYPGIKSSVSAILFLGTPHRGSPSAEYADILFKIANVMIIGSQMSRWTGPLRKELVHSLKTNAKDLLHVAEDFRVHTGTMKIASFIEQQNMRGLNERIVDDSSGVTGASTERVVPMPGCDHRAICRYGERNSNYKKLLAAIKDGIPSFQLIAPSLDGTSKVDSQFTAEESACLRSLAFPELDHRFQGISQALDDTCAWLDSYSPYQEWLQHQNVTKHQGLFILMGKPGSGKSVLMKRTLKQITRDHPSSTVISFFFNARGSSLEQCTLGLFRSLLHQLFRQHRELLREFLPYFKTKRDTYHSDWKWSLGELQEFFQSLITSFRVPSLFIFLDALDECDQAEVKSLVNFLARMTTRASSSHSRLSVCMSSRDYPHINVAKCSEVRTDSSNGQDIIKFVESELDPLFGEEDDFKKEIIRKASGIFLWVVLVVNRLVDEKDKGQDKKTMQAVLKSLPIDLHDLFARCFENIQDPCATRTLILWVLFAERSLTPAELECALLFSNEVSHDSFRLLQGSVDGRGSYEQLGKRIKHLSKGLVEIQNVPIHTSYSNTGKVKVEPRVQFIHESARDFLLQHNGLRMIDNTLDTSPIPSSHDFLARACMRYLRMKEFQWFRENSRFDYDKNMSRMILENELNNLRETYPFCKYAVHFVFNHASKAEKGGIFPVHLNHSFGGNQGQVFLSWRHINDMMKFASYSDVQGPETALLHVVAEHGILSCLVDLLNEGVPVNLKGGKFRNVLIAASRTGNPKMVQMLLDRGADINASGGDDGSALHVAAAQGHMDMVQMLLDRGADINVQGGVDGNALQAAATCGHIDVVQMLLDRGADINVQGGVGGNALQAAAAYGNIDVVQMLLDRGADINVQGGVDGNALQAAAIYGHMDVVQMLLDRGADINIQGGCYGNALQAAAIKGHSELVRILLDGGADINTQGGLHGNALQGAAYQGYSEIVRILLDYGADITAQGGRLGNALEVAAARGHSEVVRILLDHGADITAQGGYFGSALAAAAFGKYQDVVKMLKDHSTKVSAEG